MKEERFKDICKKYFPELLEIEVSNPDKLRMLALKFFVEDRHADEVYEIRNFYVKFNNCEENFE